MILYLLLLTLLPHIQQTQPATAEQLIGAWKMTNTDGTQGLWIMEDDHFSITYYKTDKPEFISTEGGKWSLNSDGSLALRWEFNTQDTQLINTQSTFPLRLGENTLNISNATWEKLDSGTPGALKGAWLITGRQRDNEMVSMTPGARKTMKILSGTRFQWIAYNSETGEFFGTGGGTYTTENGKYTENIDFFSRDNTRVGASLIFNFELKDGKWHHSGLSSKGEPLYEIWSTRQSIGI